jgi:N-acetylglutamate synthase
MDLQRVRLLDSLCARAWPATESQEANGWVLRAARGISLRANSVWPRDHTGGATLSERIREVEAFYEARDLPPRFQISPASAPLELDTELERRGYVAHTSTDVMIATPLAIAAGATVEVLAHADGDWRTVMLDSAADPADARGRLAIVDAIPLPRRHALARVDGEPAAIGLGTLEQGHLGLFAMRTLPRFRRRGLARAVVAALLAWAVEENAHAAFLQVETDNDAAIALYRGVGFSRLYGYRYYCKS